MAGRFEEARALLLRFRAEKDVLSNLVKVFSSQGQGDKVESILWGSLQLDPNYDNALHR